MGLTKMIMYDVYQFNRHKGRYGEHVRVASFRTMTEAKRKADLIWDSGRTPSIKERKVNHGDK